MQTDKKDSVKKEAAKKAELASKLVSDRFDIARSFRVTTQDEVWKRSYNNYRGIIDQTAYPWRSKLHVPWSFTVVETIIPKVFARDPKWRAIARNPDFTADGPRTIQDLLSYQWSKMDMRIKMYDYIKDSLIYSKAFAKVGWNFQTKTKTIMEPVVGENDKITFKKVVKGAIEYDDPTVDIVDPYDIYIDPDSTTSGYGGDCRYMIHRKTMTLDDIKQNPNYENVDKIKRGGYAETYMDKQSRHNNNTPQKDKHNDLIEILEYWEKDRLIVIADRSVVLRDTPNPYSFKDFPFVELDDYRDPHKLYGQSELSVIDPLQREVNSIRNQRRDYDNLALNPVVRMIPGTLRNPNSATMAPGNVWMVSDLSSMDVFTLPQLQGSSSEIEDRTARDIKMSVAIDEIGIGLLPEGSARRSATEVVTAQSMAGKRFAIKIALLEESVKKIGELVFALNQQFLDQEKLIQVVGQRGATEWVKFTPEDIRGEYMIAIETGSMLPKDEIAARQEAVQLLQYITPIIGPVIKTNPAVILPVIRMVLDTFELPGKQEILDELNSALGQAKQRVEEQNMAQNAATEATAIAALQGQAGAEQTSVVPPETAQGSRADMELQALLGNA